tara:strand:- start:4832 stop:5560 length:729 start_codon:yes stop_codon:yes gene_type:complete
MRKLDLLESFPKSSRKIQKGWRTEENKQIAKRFDREFFDGDRINGYGGYFYDGRWKGIVSKLQEVYGIDKNSSVLDIGCAKGFLLYDLKEMIPGIKVAGIDISKYAVGKAMDGYADYWTRQAEFREKPNYLEEQARNEILPHMIVASCDDLPYADNSFDVVLSINTAHNLPLPGCEKAIREMIRVGKNKQDMFIQLDAYTTPEEKKRMDAWGITCLTTMYDTEWLRTLEEQGYDGDYFWTIV